MRQGAYRAELWAGEPETSQDEHMAAMPADWEGAEASSRLGARLLAGALALLALGWIAAFGWTVAMRGRFDPAALVADVGLACAPLALIALAWLLIRGSDGREGARFRRTAATVREETERLEAALAAVAARLDESREALGREREALHAHGSDAADRVAAVGAAVSQDVERLRGMAATLEFAATAARADMAVLFADLPRAEAEARRIAETLDGAGRETAERAEALAAQLGEIAARAREADEVTGGAAQRLAAQLIRIEAAGSLSARQIDEAADKVTVAVEDALDFAARALDRTREGIDQQATAMRAMVDTAETGMTRGSAEAATALSKRLEQLQAQMTLLDGKLHAQREGARALIEGLETGIDGIEKRFLALDEVGHTQSAVLHDAVSSIVSQAERARVALHDGSSDADALIGRAETLKAMMDALGERFAEAVPATLDRIREGGERSRQALEAAGPVAAELEATAAAAAGRLAEAEALLARQQKALETLAFAIDERLEEVSRKAGALDTAIGVAELSARRLAEGAGPTLVNTLVQVRDTAAQAAERARQAISDVIPESAEALAKASGEALERTVGEGVEAQLARVRAAGDEAVAAAIEASSRLQRQMLGIAETSAAIEQRIVAGREEIEAADRDSFPRRAALLIEQLNSAAIDVAKILSTEVTDTAWAAYLKGDRGIFTRRAVRLLDNAEAREVLRHYEAEPEFREQVNRYVHDFEALLRPVIAGTGTSPLGVTLLSSDMGKLYVALAQAIQRLRG